MARVVALVACALGVVSVKGEEACVGDECTEEASLLSVKSFSDSDTPPWAHLFKSWHKCKNRYGVEFPCGEGECCGDSCKAKGDLCCFNDNGNSFPCQKGGSCCGNACAAPGSKCCTAWNGYKYPVSKDSDCARDSLQCYNRPATPSCAARSRRAVVTSVLVRE